MIDVRAVLLISTILHCSNSKLIEPNRSTIDDDNSLYAPHISVTYMEMGMAYNNSIPLFATKVCEANREIPCPSPSADGTYRCISHSDICDLRPQCPRGEDETPVICFFREMHQLKMMRLRNYAISLIREILLPKTKNG